MTKYRCIFCNKDYIYDEFEKRCFEGRPYRVRTLPRCECGRSSYIKVRERVIKRFRKIL